MDLMQRVMKDGLFAGMTDDQQAAVLGLVEVREVKENAILLEEGRPSSMIYVTWEGRFAIFKRRSPDQSPAMPMAVYDERGMVFGEVSFLHGGVCTATVRALDQGKVLVITHADLDRLKIEHPDVEALIMRNIVSLLLLKLGRAIETITDSRVLGGIAKLLAKEVVIATQHVRDEHALEALAAFRA